jgi:hypothetical protein
MRSKDWPRASPFELKSQEDISPFSEPDTTRLELGEKAKQVMSVCVVRGVDSNIFVCDLALQTYIVRPQLYATSVPWGETSNNLPDANR